MSDKVKIDLRPYIASAIARNERAYARGRALYYEHPAECEAEALKSGLKNHRAITSGRAEYEIKARQMLGVLCYYDEAQVTSVMRRGWQSLYAAIKADRKPRFSPEEDDDATDLLFVAAYYCMVLGVEFPPRLQPVVAGIVEAYEQEPGSALVTAVDRKNAKAAYPSAATGTAALDDAPDQAAGEPFELLAHFMGLGLSDHLYGIEFTAEQRAMCAMLADGNEALLRPLGYFAMLICAIKADRRYIIESHAERLIIDAQTAQIEAARQKQAAEAAAEQAVRANSELDEARRRIESLENERRRLQDELAGRAGDAQELAALRSALYAAEQEEPPELPEARPELPADLRIVCMGGHQRWITQMQHALPQITYVSADVGCDEQLLRNADAVWFRADYMSHKFFTPAIAICRAAGVPVYYFSGRGAERCIDELCRTMTK